MIAAGAFPNPETATPEEFAQVFGEMQGTIIGFWIAAFLLFQIPRNWYAASEYRYFATMTRFQEMGFEVKMSRWAYIWLMLTNSIIVLATLTIATPLAYIRILRFASNRVVAHGALSPDRIGQSPEAGPGRGEGLADAFDVGGL